MRKTTIVESGRLFINGNTTDFSADDNVAAILVQDTAALGGTGTITIAANKSVVVEDGGSLIAGLDGTAGTTTFSLGADASLNLTAAVGNVGWLLFDLGSSATAGSTYDQIVITGGNLAIGDDLLGFADFEFTVLEGFGVGTYTLLSSTSLIGSLADPSLLSGQIDGLDATLSQSGDAILLTVIPEPRALAFAAGLIALCVVFLRQKRR